MKAMEVMRAIEVVKHLKKEKPEMLENIPEKKAAALIRNAWIQLGKHIDETGEGVINVPGFGNFRVRQVEREKDGQTVTVKRIIFRPAVPKAKDEQQDAE